MSHIALCFVWTLSVLLAIAANVSARNGIDISLTHGPTFIDDINGLDYKVGFVSTYTYTFSMESDVTINGASIGFIMYSPDGSLDSINWIQTPANIGQDGSGKWGDNNIWEFGGSQLTPGPDSLGGALPSTWMTGGVGIIGYGPSANMPGMDFVITFPGVDNGILCVDSAFFPPGGEWLVTPISLFEWAGGGGDLAVGGSRDHAFCVTTFVNPHIAPVFSSCPGLLSIGHCDTLRFQAKASVPSPGAHTISYSATTTGTGIVTVDPQGYLVYAPGVGEVGTISIIVHAAELGGSESDCITEVLITNNSPVITCPPNITVNKGESKTSMSVNVSDSDVCDIPVYSLVSVSPTPVGSVTVDPSTGAVTFESDSLDAVGGIDTNYEVCIRASDGIDSVECCITFTVLENKAFCITIEQTDTDNPRYVLLGEQVDICINYESGSEQISGFDFFISYEPTALSIVGVTEGNIFDDYEWEYFQFRFGPDSNCTAGCQTGKLRIVGLADLNNGSNSPNNLLLADGDQFACVTFLVTAESNYACQFSPIRWEWIDCGDNTLASTIGDTLYMSRNVYDFIGSDYSNSHTLWRADLTGADQLFPTKTGSPSECDIMPETGAKPHFIDFKNGGVNIVCAESIDDRGDINLNGLSYEIADAVMFVNYLVSGLTAFDSHVDASIRASEINCDSVPLTVADLVYLWRVVTGHALPCLGESVVDVADTATVTTNADIISSNKALGAALFVFEGQVTPTLLATNMQMGTDIVDGNTHVLIYSFSSQSEFISPGPMLQSDGTILSVETSDTLGATLAVEIGIVNGDVVSDTVTFRVNGAGVVSSDKTLGAALFVYEGVVTPILLATNMRMGVGMVDGNTNVLIIPSLGQIEYISPGPVLQCEGKLLSAEASDTLGGSLPVKFDFATDVNGDDNSSLPQSFSLSQNYPNPFNPTTTIKVDFPRASDYKLTIYNIRGQKVDQQSGSHSAGTLNYIWEPRTLPSGVYFYKLQAGDFVATKKLVLLK